MTRNRVEDLGRISVMLANLLETSLFSEERIDPARFCYWYSQQEIAHQEEILTRFAYGLEYLEKQLLCLKQIADGTDELNQK